MNQISRHVTINKNAMKHPTSRTSSGPSPSDHHCPSIFQPDLCCCCKQQAPRIRWIYSSGEHRQISALCSTYLSVRLVTLENPYEKPRGISQRGTTVKNKPYFLSLGLGGLGRHPPRKGLRNYFCSKKYF